LGKNLSPVETFPVRISITRRKRGGNEEETRRKREGNEEETRRNRGETRRNRGGIEEESANPSSIG
jgi:hypothetical protein